MIIFEDVKKTYSKELFKPNKMALKGLSFSLDKGKVLGLVGANGAGKSTSLRLLMNFIYPDSGEIRVFGKSPEDFGVRREIGYLPEIASFPSNLSILDLIRFTGKTCGLSRSITDDRGEKWLHELELHKARRSPLKTYSKGMQQRANFVLALINDPELLILDEPMSGLDPMGRNKISCLIQQLKSDGKTVLFCSHILEDVDRVADEILLLHEGQQLFFGSPIQLAAEERKPTMAEAFVSMVEREAAHD